MSFQDAAQGILDADGEPVSSPRFPPRNHDDLVHAKEYEELLDTYGSEADVRAANPVVAAHPQRVAG